MVAQQSDRRIVESDTAALVGLGVSLPKLPPDLDDRPPDR
jgi:hypothetical protein